MLTMRRETIDRIQRPLFFIAFGAPMLGLGAKANLAVGRHLNFIDMGVFLNNLNKAPLFAWVYWICIFVFFVNFLTLMIFEYLKRRP